ncbi:MAG: transposase [bacterium]
MCPQGHKLTSNGTWYQNHPYKTKQYKTKSCKGCPVKALCTKSEKGRVIERNENIEATQRNKQTIENNKELYKRRQEIVEHPFGTIKRQWGFDYTLMKGKKKVDGEVGLIFIAYLMRRLMSILGLNGLKEAVQSLLSSLVNRIPVIKLSKNSKRSFLGYFLPKTISYHFPLNNCTFTP